VLDKLGYINAAAYAIQGATGASGGNNRSSQTRL